MSQVAEHLRAMDKKRITYTVVYVEEKDRSRVGHDVESEYLGM